MQIFDNALLYNPVFCKWIPSSFSVENGKVLSVGKPGALHGGPVTNLRGARVIPGLIDAHVHIESTLLTPHEFGRLVVSCGVTTAIADPHEIANVAGLGGLDFMMQDAQKAPMDIFFMLPSCVPATPADVGGAVLSADDLKKYVHNPRVLGLGEMMNVPGVLSGDNGVAEKLKLCTHIDGHAPGLSGEPLCRYIGSGIKSDHECISAAEAREKLMLGMYIYLREGDAAKNVEELAPIVTPHTASHCCFATDDRHVDSVQIDGSIDNCIRTAVKAGMPLELALRVATLSAAECFNLSDRGIIAPGKIADFCILEPTDRFAVYEVYKSGVSTKNIASLKKEPIQLTFPPFLCTIPEKKDLALPDGTLRVIGLVPGEIITTSLALPKTAPGLQKIVCLDRYRAEGFGLGVIQGISMNKGAIATSIAHDTHNIIATGTSDDDIISAISAVVHAGGGMAVVIDGRQTVLPLPCGGIMTFDTFERVCYDMEVLQTELARTGAAETAFMSLSFMSLTVVPHLKLTPRGLFDGDVFADVTLVG